MGWKIVNVPVERAAEALPIIRWAFASVTTENDLEHMREILDWSRSIGIELDADELGAGEELDAGGLDSGIELDSGKLVAFSDSWHFDLPVPGGTLPASGLTWVSVHPGYRRQGMLRAMLTRHFAESLQRGEYASILTAAEVPIYTRFGYGQVDRLLKAVLPRGVGLWDVSGASDVKVRFEKANYQLHGDLTAQVYAQRPRRPFTVPVGSDGSWSGQFYDPKEEREGMEMLRVAIAERDQKPTGFAFFRRKADWSEYSKPAGIVRIVEIVANDPATTRALWGVLTDMDLMTQIETPPLPFDDPLFALLKDPREAQIRVCDMLHLRLLDLPKALEARRYQVPVDLVLEVSDKLLPANAGKWRLQGGSDGAEVQRVDAPADLAPADLALDIRILSGLYAGGFSVASFGDAGLITEHTPGSLERLALAFASYRLPGTSHGF